MKKMFFALSLLCAADFVIAGPAEKSLWAVNCGAAQKAAAAQKKPMLLLFTAPGWCGYCVKLEKEVLATPEFRKFAAKTVPVMLDFTEDSKVTPAMKEWAQRCGVQYFPTMVLADSSGKVLVKKVGSSNNPAEYVKELAAGLPKK